LFGRLFGFRTYGSTFIIGVMNGFLPCGLVYVALAGALVSDRALEGAFYMMAFGAGTVPALLVLPLIGNVFNLAYQNLVRKMLPYLVILLGILFIMRGMNLGIPYLSPKMDQAGTRHQTEKIQKPDCCH
jgi:sulfite exporter TauE/SafE